MWNILLFSLFVVSLIITNGEQKFCLWNRDSTAEVPDDLLKNSNWLNGIWEKSGVWYGWPYYIHIDRGTSCGPGGTLYAFRGNEVTDSTSGRWIIALGLGNTIDGAYMYCDDQIWPQNFQWHECTKWMIADGAAPGTTYTQDSGISITETDTCPDLLCNTLQYYRASCDECCGTYTRESRNVYRRDDSNSDTQEKYLFFNDHTFQWLCGNELDTSCTYPAGTAGGVSIWTYPQPWTGVDAGGDFSVIAQNTVTVALICGDSHISTPSPVPGTDYPSRSPSSPDTPNPTASPIDGQAPNPTRSPVDPGQTPSPTKSPIDPGQTSSPTKSPLDNDQTDSPTKAPQPSPTRAPLTADETAVPTSTNSPTRAPLTGDETAVPTTAGSDSVITLNCKIYWLCVFIALYKLLF